MERRSKYNAKRVEIDGITFDSGAEARRYQELKLLEAAGEITGLRVHERILLLQSFTWQGKKQRAVYYEADFVYTDKARIQHIEDVKGVRTAVYKIKKKMLLLKMDDQHTIFEEVDA